jgi:anti-anti-sigma factor
MVRPGRDPEFAIDESDVGGVRVLAPRGELDLATAPTLCARVDAARATGHRRLVLDLTDLEFCDSQGLRALLGASAEVRAQGGRLAVAASGGSAVARLLDVSGAGEMLPVRGDAPAAIAAVRA